MINHIELHTPADISVSPTRPLLPFAARASTGPEWTRSGYVAAENLQKGADAPSFSLLRAIFCMQKIPKA